MKYYNEDKRCFTFPVKDLHWRKSGSNSSSTQGMSTRSWPIRERTPSIHSSTGRSKRNTVSHFSNLLGNVRRKFPSRIHSSWSISSTRRRSNSSLPTVVRSARCQIMSRWYRGSPVFYASFLLNTLFPAPEHPTTITFFIIFSIPFTKPQRQTPLKVLWASPLLGENQISVEFLKKTGSPPVSFKIHNFILYDWSQQRFSEASQTQCLNPQTLHPANWNQPFLSPDQWANDNTPPRWFP